MLGLNKEAIGLNNVPAIELLENKVRVDREENIPLSSIDMSDAIFNPQKAQTIADNMRTQKQKVRVFVRARLVTNEKGGTEVVYDPMDGYHRVAAGFLLADEDSSKDTIEAKVSYGMSDADVYEHRFIAIQSAPELLFRRAIRWLPKIYETKPFSQKLSLLEALSKCRTKTRIEQITTEEEKSLREFIATKSTQCKRGIQDMLEIFKSTEGIANEIIDMVELTRGRDRATTGMISRTALLLLGNKFRGEKNHNIQRGLAQFIAERRLKGPYIISLFEQIGHTLTSDMSSEQVYQAASGVDLSKLIFSQEKTDDRLPLSVSEQTTSPKETLDTVPKEPALAGRMRGVLELLKATSGELTHPTIIALGKEIVELLNDRFPTQVFDIKTAPEIPAPPSVPEPPTQPERVAPVVAFVAPENGKSKPVEVSASDPQPEAVVIDLSKNLPGGSQGEERKFTFDPQSGEGTKEWFANLLRGEHKNVITTEERNKVTAMVAATIQKLFPGNSDVIISQLIDGADNTGADVIDASFSERLARFSQAVNWGMETPAFQYLVYMFCRRNFALQLALYDQTEESKLDLNKNLDLIDTAVKNDMINGFIKTPSGLITERKMIKRGNPAFGDLVELALYSDKVSTGLMEKLRIRSLDKDGGETRKAAADFFPPDWEWKAATPSNPQAMKDAAEKSNKEVEEEIATLYLDTVC